MKRKAIFLMTTMVFVTILAAVTVIGSQTVIWDHYAYGTLTNYQDAPSASIQSGF